MYLIERWLEGGRLTDVAERPSAASFSNAHRGQWHWARPKPGAGTSVLYLPSWWGRNLTAHLRTHCCCPQGWASRKLGLGVRALAPVQALQHGLWVSYPASSLLRSTASPTPAAALRGCCVLTEPARKPAVKLALATEGRARRCG